MIGSSPLGSFGPAEKNVAKKKGGGGCGGEATLWTKTRKKMTTVSRQVLMTTDQAPSEKYFLYCKNYLGFLVFSHF